MLKALFISVKLWIDSQGGVGGGFAVELPAVFFSMQGHSRAWECAVLALDFPPGCAGRSQSNAIKPITTYYKWKSTFL